MTTISNQVPGDWKQPKVPSDPGKPAHPSPSGGEKPAPAPELLPKDLGPKLPGKPQHPVAPCIGLAIRPDLKQDIEQIRHSKGTSNVQALLEFKDNLQAADTHELENAQRYLVDEMANPDNQDDPLLGALLKAVNQELNNRRRGPFPIEPLPFPPGFDPAPMPPKPPTKPFPRGGDIGRVVD